MNYPHEMFKVLEGRYNKEVDQWHKDRAAQELALDLAGPSHKNLRQAIIQSVSGKNVPKSAAGVHALEEVFKDWIKINIQG